jgi:hypothetical protein
MIKRILLALALVGAIAACNSPGASSTPAGATTGPALSSPSAPDTSSPSAPDVSSPSTEPSESPAAS